MANLLLGWPNAVTTGALTASGAEAALPVTNLANDQGSFTNGWQLPALVGWFQVDAKAPFQMRAFSLHRTNLTTAATIRIRVWATPDTGAAPVYDSGVKAAGIYARYGQTVHALPNTITGQTVRFDLSDPTNPDGHVNIPLAFVGPCWQPYRNMNYDSSNGRKVDQTRSVLRSGGVLIRTNSVKRAWDLVLVGVRDFEVIGPLDSLDAYAALGNNVLFVPDPDDAAKNMKAVFGEVTTNGNITWPYQSPEARGWRADVVERL